MTGIYEQIINSFFKRKLDAYGSDSYFIGTKKIGKEEAITHLSQYLYGIIRDVFKEYAESEEGIEKCIEFANSTIAILGKSFKLEDYENNLIEAQNSILTSVIEKSKIDNASIEEFVEKITPKKSLTKSSLFTGKNVSETLGGELKKEILSSDSIDLIVSFIKKSGIEVIYKELEKFTRLGNKLRVITTTYTRATDYEAIVKLSKLPNTEIKISYNCDVDRLHAKAYIFIRKNGFSTAFVGSSNISEPALRDGLEWNLKVTQKELPEIIDQMENTFNSYWADSSFETFKNGIDNERLQEALEGNDKNYGIDYSVFDLIKAKEYQKEILDKLDVERKFHNHWRNLVVAATGTGKTVISAFDYKRFKEERERENKPANFLFVVHREEIIRQACDTFRYVLEDENFGEMWFGGHEASNFSHLFASKDLLNNRLDNLDLPEDYYDYIIIDEAHHIVAQTYQKILSRFKPKILLGLTATPERMDGQDIRKYFDEHISAEIRLDTALNNQLLSPFKYYGVTDSVDYSQLKWNRGQYDTAALSTTLINNERRISVILHAIERYISNYRNVKALCFCVSQEHAKYMDAKFKLAGLNSATLTSENSKERNKQLRLLKKGKINYLFVVDMFNEGVDIPVIDTVLFLRPTESLTIFLQQFGRGLRKAEGKQYLTVLDFVGMANKEFNFSSRFRALIGKSSMSVEEEVERDFIHMPLGCEIHLEPKAKEYVLRNIRENINRCHKNNLIYLIQQFRIHYDMPLSLANFVRMNNIPLDGIYKGKLTWNDLCYEAQVSKRQSHFSVELNRAVKNRWLATDSFSFFSFLKHLANERFKIKEKELTEEEKAMSVMISYDLFNQAGRFNSLQEMFDLLASEDLFIDELEEVSSLLINKCEALECEDNSSIPYFPLKLHGVYTKSQIQIALGTSTLSKASSSREGVERTLLRGKKVEAMFVDIIKDREIGSNTNYNDFAQSLDSFNWETQNSTSQKSLIGQSYIKNERTMLLFVRKQASDPDVKTRTMGYVYLGEVELVSYEGNKPMKILWHLKTEMPGSVFEYAAKYRQAI